MKLVRWLFLMPMLCLLLILVPTGALAEEIRDTSEGNVPVTIIDDTTGASPANGTVTLPDYIYYQNATYPYYVDRGDTVTLNVVPDEGYEIGDLRVTYKKIEAGSDLDLAFDEETSSFTLPARGCVSVTIHVTFVRPGGVYGIDTNIVERSSGRVTGNTVELDKTTASPGETVVFNVVMNPGTQFYDLGEDRSYPYVGYLAADNSHVYVDLDQVDEDTWSFVMPEHDVTVVCGFCFTDYSICFEATEELLKFNWMMVKNGAPRVDITEDSPGTAVEGDTIRLMTSFDQLSYPNYDFPYQITGMTLHYTLDGEDVTQELTCTHSDWYRNPAAEFTMPCADVTVSCSLERAYNVNTETDDGGMIVRSQRKALPGDVVTLSSEAYDPLMEFPVFTVIAANGDPVDVDENNSFVMPEGDVSVYVEFTPTHFPYISRTWNGEQLVEEELTTPGDYKFLTSNITDLTEGWYIVRESVTYGTRLKTSGTVNILLMDGSTLTANNGIYVREDSHLNIYTQAGDNGKLIAKSGSGAGIGGNKNACGGFLAIHGGVVEARGGDDCAGIGGGYGNESGMIGITINGQGEEGWALAQVVNYFICKYFFSAHYGGAGIGGGDEGSGCNVRILDGASVIASTGYKKAQPIGKGNDGYQSRSLEIYEDAKISYGSLANEETGELNVEGTALWSERYQVCRNKSTVLIEPCDHSEAEYEDCGRGHKMHCPSCEFDEQVIRDHEFSDDSEFCTLCGAKRILLSFEAGEGHGSTVNVFSGAGMQKMPEDLTFYAHFRNADNWIPAGFAIAGEDQTVIYRPGAELEVTEDTVFVAVYADPYQLWVGSTKVTPDNQDDVLGDGKVSYDPYTYTLHLDDPGPIPGVTRGNLIYGVDMPLTVTGTANFSEDTGNFSEYIYVMNGSVTLDGEFICTGSTHFGIAGNGITIRGGSLLVDSPDYGLYSFGAIRIENEVERVQIDVGTNRAIYIPYPEYGGVILGDHLYVKECVKEDGEPGDDILDARHVVIEHGIPVKINGVSGSFNDKIKLNYYFDIPELLLRDNGAYVTLTNERTGEENTLYINEAEYVTDKGYRFSIPLAAKEAGDIITARAFDSDGNALMIRGNAKGIDYTETGVQYNLMDYFTWLESNGNESEKSVGKAAKDYCLAAQIYFDYYAEGLSVSSAVDDVSEEMLSGYIAGREGKLPTGVSIRGVTAMLESDNTFRLYLKFSKVDPTDFTYTIDGKEAELNKRADGAYYLALDEGVWSNHLQDTHTYSVSDGTDTYTITASVLTYARSCAIKNIKEESDLGKALYLYNQAAVSAFQ